jgi:hypothetical protein
MIDEFIQKNEKVLTFENPISLFRKVLSQVGTTEQVSNAACKGKLHEFVL